MKNNLRLPESNTLSVSLKIYLRKSLELQYDTELQRLVFTAGGYKNRVALPRKTSYKVNKLGTRLWQWACKFIAFASNPGVLFSSPLSAGPSIPVNRLAGVGVPNSEPKFESVTHLIWRHGSDTSGKCWPWHGSSVSWKRITVENENTGELKARKQF